MSSDDKNQSNSNDAGQSALVVVKAVEGEMEPRGHELIDALVTAICQYVVVTPAAAYAIALWVMHTWAFDAAETAPRLLIKSPAMRSGKTKLLTLVQYLVRNPLASSNMTPATVFRVIEATEPTLLIDEADTFLKSNVLHGVINSGHKRENAFVYRMDKGVVRRFSTWAPIAIAGIGNQVSTIEDRSVVVALKRRRFDENVAKLTPTAKAELTKLKEHIARWVIDNIDVLGIAEPIEVPGLSDRAEDNWQPLFAIASVAGGDSLDKAKASALALLKEHLEADDNYLPLLLHDIREAFAGADKIASEELVHQLIQLEHRPWAEWKGMQRLSKNQLAALLRPLKIQPMTIRLSSTRTPKGYKIEQFEDAFARYLPPAEDPAPQPSDHPHL